MDVRRHHQKLTSRLKVAITLFTVTLLLVTCAKAQGN
jgi:hypothetical protein